MVAVTEPDPLMVAMLDLAQCLCQQIETDESPGVCYCGVLPGAGIPVDLRSCEGDDDCGMAYVRLVSPYPSSQVGVLHLEPGNCGAGLGFDLEIGIYRCFPLTEDGSSPEPSVLLEVTNQQVKDYGSMRRALYCCDWLPPKDFIVGQYTPVGPAGGVLGGTIPLSAWLP